MGWQEAVGLIQKHISAKKLGDKDAALVRKALRDQPELWQSVGDMALQVQSRMIDKMVSQAVAELAIEHGLEEIRDSLGRKDATMLENLLIDQIVICWLNVYGVQHQYTQNMAGSLTLSQGDYWERRLTSAQARYLRAIETLARVRRLMKVVPVQVNLAEQQINIANAG